MQIEILTDRGMSINLVRYFTLNEKQILIYLDSKDMIDEQGHVTIHISEVVNDGHLTANNVSDVDWEDIKNIIKMIVNSNKNNQPLTITDLDYTSLDGISIVDNRALKLMSNYVDLLKANQPIFEKSNIANQSAENDMPNITEVPVGNMVQENVAADPSNDVDYQSLYNEQLQLVEQLNSEIAEYRNKIETLKNIINN